MLNDEEGMQEPSENTDSNSGPVENNLSELENVKKLIKEVKADKQFHDKAFKRMRADMFMAKWGRDKDWPESSYTANIAGRHVRSKTASLYAKNPKIVAKRRETLDFAVWDETDTALQIALQTIQQGALAQQIAAQQPPVIDQTGMPVEPQLPPGFMEAQQLIADFQQGTERRKMLKKFGQTLEVLFAHSMKIQQPLDFKAAMKQLVRRTNTTGVGYVELGFAREMGPDPVTSQRMIDAKARIAHIKNLMSQQQEGELEESAAELSELENALAALQAQPEIVINEGLVFDYPQSTRVIPDRRCKQLVGFVGAQHVSVELLYTKDEVKEIFGVDVGDKYTPYKADGSRDGAAPDGDAAFDQGDLFSNVGKKKDEMLCVWKIYDKPSGLVYYVCDGYHKYLRTPAAPDVFVTEFWPLAALTFNAVESEDDLFPPSDVSLIREMQKEYNRSRQGKREHRQAARPRWGYAKGAIEEEDMAGFQSVKPFEAFGINMAPGTKLADILQAIPVPGVDPNLYDTNEIWADLQVVVGSQQAQLGGLAKATATESAISANSTSSSDSSSVDDLDSFLSTVARMGSQILMREMSVEQVQKIVGVGAVWPEQRLAEIADEIYLDIEAGSSGKPNQAVEIANWEKMLPFLLQLGSIQPAWLARETLRRMDDRMDLTEAITEGLPAIVAQNRMQQPMMGDPNQDPTQQGDKGADNTEKGKQDTAGTDAPMGDNNPEPKVTRYGADGVRQ